MEILVHVNKRVKSRPDVQLPFDQLIAIFNDSAKELNLSFVTVNINKSPSILTNLFLICCTFCSKELHFGLY